MSCEVQVRFCESVGVRFPRATRLIITGRSREILEDEVKPLVQGFLRERRLTLSESKTRITHINEGFDFLGKHIRKYNGKFLSKPAKKNIRAFLAEIKATIRENLNTPVERLIATLNPKIRGWALFHRSSASKKIVSHVDYRIFWEIKYWMRCRHPGKSLTWRRQKYYTRVGASGYVLQGTYPESHGQFLGEGMIAIPSSYPTG